MAVPIRVGWADEIDPAVPYVLKAAAARLDGDLDLAEDWLNVAASVFRELKLPNRSEMYRRESRACAWARLDAEGSGPGQEDDDP